MSTIVSDVATPRTLLVTPAQAGQMLGLKPWPVVRLCEAGELPSRMIGKTRYIPRASVVDFVARLQREGGRA